MLVLVSSNLFAMFFFGRVFAMFMTKFSEFSRNGVYSPINLPKGETKKPKESKSKGRIPAGVVAVMWLSSSLAMVNSFRKLWSPLSYRLLYISFPVSFFGKLVGSVSPTMPNQNLLHVEPSIGFSNIYSIRRKLYLPKIIIVFHVRKYSLDKLIL